jgi:transcriptional regulator with XRE-family HTH domain
MSLATLAARSGLSVSYISLLERGKRDPSLSAVEEISSALGVPVSILTFLAMESEELHELSPTLAEKLSFVALGLMKESNGAIPTSV